MKDKLAIILGVLVAIFLALVIYLGIENAANADKVGKTESEAQHAKTEAEAS